MGLDTHVFIKAKRTPKPNLTLNQQKSGFRPIPVGTCDMVHVAWYTDESLHRLKELCIKFSTADVC